MISIRSLIICVFLVIVQACAEDNKIVRVRLRLDGLIPGLGTAIFEDGSCLENQHQSSAGEYHL